MLDIAVTPDRGYALSVRGVARELATSYEVRFSDPADQDLPGRRGTVSDRGATRPASRTPTACDRFVLREVRGFNPAAPTPLWMRVRLARSGMRSVSLAVDITNYLMLELGPAAARVRRRQAERAHRGPPGPARREAGNPRPRDCATSTPTTS